MSDYVDTVDLKGPDDGSVYLTEHGQVRISTCCDSINDLTDGELDALVGQVVAPGPWEPVEDGVSE